MASTTAIRTCGIQATTKSRFLYHQDFTGTARTNSSGANYDLYGHGTHVAGIIAGNGYLSAGRYAGVAPQANLIDLRALDANGGGTDSTVIAAIQQAIALKNVYKFASSIFRWGTVSP